MKSLLIIFAFLISIVMADSQVSYPPASQAEVNAGTVKTKFVSPATLAGWTGAGGGGTITNINIVSTNGSIIANTVGTNVYLSVNSYLVTNGTVGGIDIGNGNSALPNGKNTIIGFGSAGGSIIAGGAAETLIGWGAGASITSGTGNTAIGAGALEASTGIGNIALGSNAGAILTTGNNNIEIGNQGLSIDTSIIRFGTLTDQTNFYAAGVTNVLYPSLVNPQIVLIGSDGKLGVISTNAFSSGGGLSYTPQFGALNLTNWSNLSTNSMVSQTQLTASTNVLGTALVTQIVAATNGVSSSVLAVAVTNNDTRGVTLKSDLTVAGGLYPDGLIAIDLVVGQLDIGDGQSDVSGTDIYINDLLREIIITSTNNVLNGFTHVIGNLLVSGGSTTVSNLFSPGGKISGFTNLYNFTNSPTTGAFVKYNGGPTNLAFALDGSSLTNLTGTNIVFSPVINTNFLTSQLYTNNYGNTIAVSANAALTTAAVVGVSQLALVYTGNRTNYATVVTAIGGIAGVMTNAISTMYITNGGNYQFNSTSTGAGNSAVAVGGQIFIF